MLGKLEFEKSTQSMENQSREFSVSIDSLHDRSYHIESCGTFGTEQFKIHVHSHPASQNQPDSNKTDTFDASSRNASKTIANKKQYLETIRLSYNILSNTAENLPSKKNKKLLKKSFVVIDEEQNEVDEEKIKQSLKTPLNIDLAKLSHKNKFLEFGEGLYLFNGKNWEKCHFDIDTKVQELIVSNLHIPFSTISKIKIFKPDHSKNSRQIKITYKKSNEQGIAYLDLKENKVIKKMPVNYLIFQEIITHKLTFQNNFKQTKWEKKHHICEEVVSGSYIFGEIYKKSQFFGKWEKRYIVLNNQGVFSYKSAGKKEDHSFSIDRESIEYIWTWFDLVDNYLVVKLKHGMKQTEFGIPLCNFSHLHYKNWLYYFYRLMTPNN